MRSIVVSIIVVMLVAACTVAPAASPVPSLAPTALSTFPSPTPGTPSSATPSPSAPVVGLAPDGPWSSVAWLRAGMLPLGPAGLTIHGWTGGYVAFEQSRGMDEEGNARPVVVRVSSSPDGIHWSSPMTVDTGFEGEIAIRSIVEGPAGLLALAFPFGGACGGPPGLFALWSSSDGRSWERVPLPKGFTAGRVETVAGGPAGFIALGTRSDGMTQAIWTSRDGRAWSSRKLPTVSSGILALDGVASFEGGFVLVGSVLGEDGCGGPRHISYATWFSADGTAWTRASLPGASTDSKAVLEVRRLEGHLVVIQRPPTDTPLRGWTSTDGRAWTSIGDVAGEGWWAALSAGRHAVVVLSPDDGPGPATVYSAGVNGAFTTIPQRGDVPSTDADTGGWQVAIGPTGIVLVREGETSVYLGVPS
jgi:hypothetical protein